MVSGDRGEGLLEVLVALLLLALVSTTFFSLTTATSAGLWGSQRRQAAVRCAQSVMEQVRSSSMAGPTADGSCDDARYPGMSWAVALVGDRVSVAVYTDTSASMTLFSLASELSPGVAQP